MLKGLDKFLTKSGGLVQFLDDDSHVVVGVDTGVRVLARNGQLVRRLAPKIVESEFDIWCVAANRRLDLVAGGYHDGSVSLWSLTDGTLRAQARISSFIIHGVALAELLPNESKRRWGRSQSPGLLAVTGGSKVGVLRTDNLRVLQVLSGFTERYQCTSVAAERTGRFIAAGNDGGEALIWARSPRGDYQLRHQLPPGPPVTRVLLAEQFTHWRLYVLRTSRLDSRGTQGEFSTNEVATWQLDPSTEPVLIGTSRPREATDIAVDGSGRIFTAHRHKWTHGMSSKLIGGSAQGPDVGIYYECADGVIGVAASQDGQVVFARDDDGGVARIVRQR